jgi:virginiamycin B lyase
MGIRRQWASVPTRRLVIRVLLAPMTVVAVLTFTSQTASASASRDVAGQITCALTGTVHFSPALKMLGGGTNPSRISGTLSLCKGTSGTLEPFSSTRLRGTFGSSPISCASSSQTGATLSASIRWRGKGAAARGVAPTALNAGWATGSFAGAVVMILRVTSKLGSCAGRGLRSAVVSGTISMGQAAGAGGGTTTAITGSAAPGSAATCSFSGTTTFTPPLTTSGDGTESSIDAALSGCTTNSGIVESFGSPQLEGTFASSPFTCSSSSPTNAVLSAVIDWNGSTAWPSGGIAPTTVDGSSATGSFAGAAVVSLQVPSDIAAGCTDGAVTTDTVSGTITVGPACGEVGTPLSIYPIVPPICGAQNYLPASITTGADGALWFTTLSDNLIGRTTTTGVTTFYPVPTEDNGLVWGNGGITSGPDGALWYVANGGQDIGRITTSGVASTFPLPSGIGYANSITSGPDGALWVAINNDSGNNAVGRLTTSGQFTIFANPALGTTNWNASDHREIWDITKGPDGALWFSSENASNLNEGSWIGRISTAGVVTQYPIPFAVNPGPLTAGPDGAIWFAGININGGNAIGRVTTSGVFSEYFGQPGQIGQVLGLTAGPDGALWFTNYSVPGDTDFYPYPPIGRITTGGTITTYGSAYDEEGAMGITTGPDGAMWFVDHMNDSLGRITVP